MEPGVSTAIRNTLLDTLLGRYSAGAQALQRTKIDYDSGMTNIILAFVCPKGTCGVPLTLRSENASAT